MLEPATSTGQTPPLHTNVNAGLNRREQLLTLALGALGEFRAALSIKPKRFKSAIPGESRPRRRSAALQGSMANQASLIPLIKRQQILQRCTDGVGVL